DTLKLVDRAGTVGGGLPGPGAAVPDLRQGDRTGAGRAVADRLARRSRRAGDAAENAVGRAAGVGRGLDGPGAAVPPLGQRLIDPAAGELAHGLAYGRGRAGHIVELTAGRAGRVRRGLDGPGAAVPLLGEGGAARALPHGLARRRGGTRDAVERPASRDAHDRPGIAAACLRQQRAPAD